jgi:SAM-dependent methyltransferase
MVGVVEDSVRAFYEELPFNYAESVDEQAEAIRAHNQVSIYRPLHEVLRAAPGTLRVLDVGCGAGWFVNSVAYWYGHDVCGIDLCPRPLERARATARALGVASRVRFEEGDFLSPPDWLQSERFAVVSSLGAMHHMRDCERAVRTAASLVQPGGWLHIGLYHRHGRAPLLRHFQDITDAWRAAPGDETRGRIELEGLGRWKSLQHGPYSDTFLLSWFRDQVLHPHETQWTLGELLSWFVDEGVEPLSTSLDRFSERPDWRAVVAAEPAQADAAHARLREGCYFPGFFTLLGRKR